MSSPNAASAPLNGLTMPMINSLSEGPGFTVAVAAAVGAVELAVLDDGAAFVLDAGVPVVLPDPQAASVRMMIAIAAALNLVVMRASLLQSTRHCRDNECKTRDVYTSVCSFVKGYSADRAPVPGRHRDLEFWPIRHSAELLSSGSAGVRLRGESEAARSYLAIGSWKRTPVRAGAEEEPSFRPRELAAASGIVRRFAR